MYIRQISQARKDGTRVRYLQLAHKVRDPSTGRPTDKVLDFDSDCHFLQ
jgi:hypothetical protein